MLPTKMRILQIWKETIYYVCATLPLFLHTAAPFSDCGLSKGCFRQPADCNTLMSCDVIVTWQETPDGDSLVFDLAGLSTGYVAVGFSRNQLMANTDVLVCIDNNGPSLQHFYNPVSHVNEPRQQMGVTVHNASSSDGVIQCQFTRIKYLDGETEFADLREDVYVLLAKGLQSSGFPVYHSLDRYVSSSKEDLSLFRAPLLNLTTAAPYEKATVTEKPIESSSRKNPEEAFQQTSPISNTANRQQTLHINAMAAWCSVVIFLRNTVG